MSNEDSKSFSCPIEGGDSIQSKLENYLNTNQVLLGPFHEDLLINIDKIRDLVDVHDNGLNDLQEIHQTWISSWDALYSQKDEDLKALGITRESLLADKKKFESEIYPSLLKAVDKYSGLIETINSIINKLKLQNKKE
jgi:hypothetical protein